MKLDLYYIACLISLTLSYFQEKILPAITLYWHQYQEKLFDSLIDAKEGNILTGDGRHDSMGHCAKYGAYTMMCLNQPTILHFDLVQVCISDFFILV